MCSECTLIFQKFICDDELSHKLYEDLIDKEKSFNKKKNLYFDDFQEYIQDINLISSLFKKKPKDIKILEFGSGWGFWSRLAKSFNFDVESIEISKSRINFLNDHNITTSDKIDQNKQYDFIYSNQVFEHLSSPDEEFSKIISTLKKNSFFLMKVPSSFFYKEKELVKKYSYKNILFPLEHINLYNKNVYKFLAKKYNLNICNHLVLNTGNLFGLKLYLKNFFTNSFILFKKN